MQGSGKTPAHDFRKRRSGRAEVSHRPYSTTFQKPRVKREQLLFPSRARPWYRRGCRSTWRTGNRRHPRSRRSTRRTRHTWHPRSRARRRAAARARIHTHAHLRPALRALHRASGSDISWSKAHRQTPFCRCRRSHPQRRFLFFGSAAHAAAFAAAHAPHGLRGGSLPAQHMRQLRSSDNPARATRRPLTPK